MFSSADIVKLNLVKFGFICLCSSVNVSEVCNVKESYCSKFSDLRCYYVNAQSILNKFELFQGEISLHDPDIIAISESWTHCDILTSEISLKGYLPPFRKDRVNGRGGGVLLYFREGLTVCEVLDVDPDGVTESVWCELSSGKQDKLLIGVCYDSTSNSEEQSDVLYKVIEKAVKKNAIII